MSALLDVFKKKEGKEKKSSGKKKSVLNKTKTRDVKGKKSEKKKVVNIYSSAHRILIKPIVSEKATDLGTDNKYVFQVSGRSNKKEIGNAIRNVYGVKPVKINIVNLPGKARKYGKVSGRTSNKKKAIVTLPAGHSIKIYEGV